jgi:peptidyl-prolyl cis-trans isomerase D
MLTTIREKTQGIIATIIIAFIAIPFALWGINSYFDGGSRLDVASVNGEKISEAAYRSTLEGFRRQLDPRMAENPEIKKLVVESLVDQTLLVRDADEQGYRLGSERLAGMIRELPYFQSAGKFDPKLYESLLRREGMSVPEFEARRRAEAVSVQLQVGLSNSAIITSSEVDTLTRLMRQQREVAYTTLDIERFHAGTAVTPEAVEQYYQTHPELFRTQEQVRIEYVRLAAPDLMKNYQPNDADLRKLYAEDTSKNVRPETRRASHILISLAPAATAEDAAKALAKIEGIEKQARAGADFATLARAHSQDTDSAAKGGDLGEIRAGVLPKPLEDAVFVLKPSELSKPVRTEYGYHLAKLTAYKPAVQRSFEEMKPQLAKQLRQRQGEERFFDASEKLRNSVYEQSDSLVPAAELLGLKVETTDWFGRNGGSGIAAHPRVIEAAFSAETLQQKRNSDALEIAGDTLVTIRAIGHRPAEPRPLAEVKAQIERSLRQQAAQNAARELGEKLVQEINTGQPLATVARKHGLTVHGPKLVTRDQPAGLERAVVDVAFRASRPEGAKAVAGGVDLGSKGFAVYAVTRVVDDSAKVDAATREKAQRALAAQRGAGYYSSYRAGLKQKANVKIYQERL